MQKEIYTKPELEIDIFETEDIMDIIVTSIEDGNVTA
jgi:hypothetical protein